ncbi:MAG: DUF3991 and toprim domain-containing protein [Clostridiales bacterium]|jgi:hypothetical protein|nr:DUF3991 and toprim domain-containing protein [Clostridiales bacterium]
MSNDRYTKAEYDAARQSDIISCLKSMGYELKQEGNYYKSALHNSLVINGSNGAWTWNSRDISGRQPIELVKQILIEDYGYDEKAAVITAVKRLAGTEGIDVAEKNEYRNMSAQARKSAVNDINNAPDAKFKLPEENINYNRIIAYLCTTRGLDYQLVKQLIKENKIYETKDHHNACFVAYDKNGEPKHGFLRGTISDAEKGFKKDVEFSDKSYAFTISGRPDSTKVCCFESSIDAISHASLYKSQGLDYKDCHRISLNGTSFAGLEKFLSDNSQVKEIVACLDNDPTGKKRSEALCKEYHEKGYKVCTQFSNTKDWNQDLLESAKSLEKPTSELNTQLGSELELSMD